MAQKHRYGLGDMAEPCAHCGIAFVHAHLYDLPCSGRYGHMEDQALSDMSPSAGHRYDYRVADYALGRWGTLRPEVQALATAYLGPVPATVWAIYQDAVSADAAFEVELQRVYGRNSRDARYRVRHVDPELNAAKSRKVVADAAWLAAMHSN